MTTITDEMMREMLPKAKSYSVVILRGTEKLKEPGADKVIWEHGRRNFQLRADGLLSIVCPIRDGSGVTGVGIFNATPEETKKIYDDDPRVKAGYFTFEVHQCSSFPRRQPTRVITKPDCRFQESGKADLTVKVCRG